MNTEFGKQVTITEDNTSRLYSIYLNWFENWLAASQINDNK